MPVNDDDLENAFGGHDYENVKSDDNIYVQQCATERDEEFTIFLFKRQHSNNTDSIEVTWKGKTDVAPSESTVYLQIYNRNSTTWETLDFDDATAVDTEFTLEGEQATDVGDYYDGENWVAARVYQEAK
ncbi:hypothetical protein KKH23_10630 [Patescibacteria group bacterium]|nr:hypothetical protein [Patescibacteria group bacterium]